MKKFSLTMLFAAAALFVTIGSSSLSAEMKCGAGKCGAAMMEKSVELQKPECCKGAAVGKACNCAADVKCTCSDKNNCTCGAGKEAPKAAMKCGTGKCGTAKEAPKASAKCGTGKCG